MDKKKLRRLALAAALATSVVAGGSQMSFAQTAPSTITTLAAQVGALDFDGARATIAQLQQLGITAINVGSQAVSLQDLLAMIVAAQTGAMEPAALASYLNALADSTAQASFVSDNTGDGGYYDHTEPTTQGSFDTLPPETKGDEFPSGSAG